MPSSAISMIARPPARVTRTEADVACAYFAMFVSASEATK